MKVGDRKLVPVTVEKIKKETPTVITVFGRRYVHDPNNEKRRKK